MLFVTDIVQVDEAKSDILFALCCRKGGLMNQRGFTPTPGGNQDGVAAGPEIVDELQRLFFAIRKKITFSQTTEYEWGFQFLELVTQM